VKGTFEPEDLTEAKNLPKVTKCVEELAELVINEFNFCFFKLCYKEIEEQSLTVNFFVFLVVILGKEDLYYHILGFCKCHMEKIALYIRVQII
jgi:hypothetical protein